MVPGGTTGRSEGPMSLGEYPSCLDQSVLSRLPVPPRRVPMGDLDLDL